MLLRNVGISRLKEKDAGLLSAEQLLLFCVAN